MDEITSKSDAYRAQNMHAAAYVCFNFPIGTRIKLITGLRYEYNKQSLQSFINQGSVSPSVTTHFALPSLNLSVSINEKMLVRLAYGETVNRPEFREWSPFYFYDFEFNAGNYGSLFPTVFYPSGYVLKVAQIHNADLRYEWYPDYGDMIHVGGFFKYFKDPIQQVITATGGSDSKAFTFINGDHAMVYGAEIDLRKNLGFLNNHIMSGFTLVFNAAYVNSKLILPNLTNLVTTTKLQGQSPYVVNAGIYYQNDSLGLQASLLYNVFGPRIYAIGNAGYGNVGEMAKNTLDFSVSKTFFKKLTVTFAIQDLINQSSRLMLDIDRNNKFENKGLDRNILSYKTGRYYTVGLKFKL
jgi:TonB-dependent receptor